MDLATCACWLSLTLFSQHIDPNGLNQTNPGIGVEINDWVAGEYRNSFRETSWYLGKDFNISYKDFRFGLVGGVITGYERKTISYDSQPIYSLTTNGLQQTGTINRTKEIGNSPGYFSPMVAPVVSYEGKVFGANIIYIPDPTNWKQSAFGFQLKFRM